MSDKVQIMKEKLSEMKAFIKKVEGLKSEVEYYTERIQILRNFIDNPKITVNVSEKPGVYLAIDVPNMFKTMVMEAAIIELQSKIDSKSREIEELMA